jgi:adenosylcobinamide-GDP ribazoletransferase
MGDAWRLALGTLTCVPTPPPGALDRPVAARAMLLAPLAVLPLGAAFAVVLWGGRELELSLVAVAAAAIGVLALGSRALHLDGLSDTVDGLTASHQAERSLAVMRSGTAGPAGVVSLVVVLGIQAGALVALMSLPRGPFVALVLVCLSRGSLSLTCVRGVPAARVDGLGVGLAGSVARFAAGVQWLVMAVLAGVVFAWAGLPWWHGVAGVCAAAAVVGLLVAHAVRRLGGVTGDVFGAAVELSLAALLVSAS